MELDDAIADREEHIVLTGGTGFIGRKVLLRLLELGFHRIRCITRLSRATEKMKELIEAHPEAANVELMTGNLLSPADCLALTKDAAIIYHLAAGRGEKSFPDAFLNSVVTTRNLLEAALRNACLKRFVNVSSFATYTNRNKPKGRVLDETCPIEDHPERRGDPYCFAKVKQDQLLEDYGARLGVPYVILRPGYVYGPGNAGITGRVGINTFGVFLHLGARNPVPLTYVDNCADAIVLAGLTPGINGEVFNVVDDALPSSRQFLRLYKRNVGYFRSIYVPRFVSYLLCWAWESYSAWSEGQLPPVFNRRRWHAEWKGSRYSNQKLKSRLKWTPKVSLADGLKQHFQSCKEKIGHA